MAGPLQDRYIEALGNIPPPGAGCHPSLLSAANYGVKIGIDMNQLFEDIRANIPHGRRRVPDREIIDTVKKACQDHKGQNFTPRPQPKPVVKDGKTSLHKIIDQAQITDEADLWESSPNPDFGMIRRPITFLFLKPFITTTICFLTVIGFNLGLLGDTIRTASDWITYFKNGGKTSPFIILNPLTGVPALTKSGDKETLRGLRLG